MNETLKDGTPVAWLREGDMVRSGADRQIGFDDIDVYRQGAWGGWSPRFWDHWREVRPLRGFDGNPITEFRVGDIINFNASAINITVHTVPGTVDPERPLWRADWYTGRWNDNGAPCQWSPERSSSSMPPTLITQVSNQTNDAHLDVQTKETAPMSTQDKTQFGRDDIETLIRTTLEWEGACIEGKIEFLCKVMNWKTGFHGLGESFITVIERNHPDRADEYLRKAGIRTDVKPPRWTPVVGDCFTLENAPKYKEAFPHTYRVIRNRTFPDNFVVESWRNGEWVNEGGYFFDDDTVYTKVEEPTYKPAIGDKWSHYPEPGYTEYICVATPTDRPKWLAADFGLDRYISRYHFDSAETLICAHPNAEFYKKED